MEKLSKDTSHRRRRHHHRHGCFGDCHRHRSCPYQRFLCVTFGVIIVVATIAAIGLYFGGGEQFFGKTTPTNDNGDPNTSITPTHDDHDDHDNNNHNNETENVSWWWPPTRSDVPVDSNLRLGTLDNGMRYMILPRPIQTNQSTNPPPPQQISFRLHVQAGSMQENDDQRGLAHYVEHMLFNGLKHFSANELIETMQRHGIQFGSDVTAFTMYDHTVYQLDVPMTMTMTTNQTTTPSMINSTSSLTEQVPNSQQRRPDDLALAILRDFCDGALFLPEEIDQERGIILSEINVRETTVKLFQRVLDTLLPDHTLTARPMLGNRASVQTLARDAFLDFYDTYYKIPSHWTLAIVMDIHVGSHSQQEEEDLRIEEEISTMVNRIEQTFGSMTPPVKSIGINHTSHVPEDLATAEVPHGRGFQTAVIVEQDVPYETVYLYAVRPYSATTIDTKDTRTHALSNQLAQDILSSRLNTLMEAENATIAYGEADSMVIANSVEMAWVQVVLSPHWRENKLEVGIQTLEQEFRQVMDHGFTPYELETSKAKILQHYQEAANKAKSRSSPYLADQLLQSIETRSVPSSPQDNLRIAMDALNQLSVQNVHETFVKYWSLDTLTLVYITSEEISGMEDELMLFYRQSQKNPIDMDDMVTNMGDVEIDKVFAYHPETFGPKGVIVSDEMVTDLGIRQILLSNNVRVNVKSTDFEDSSILLRANFGTGRLGQPLQATGLDMFSERLINEGGLGLHSQSDLEAIFAGEMIGLYMTVEGGSFVFHGETTPESLETQLLLLAAYLTDPGFRPEAARMFRNNDVPLFIADIKQSLGGPLEQMKSTLRGGDKDGRFAVPTEEGLLSLQIEDAMAWISPQLESSYLELTLVGDLPPTVIDSILQTVGALPTRNLDRAFPSPTINSPSAPQTFVYTYQDLSQEDDGSGGQAAAIVVWKIPSFTEATMEEAIVLEILSSIFEDRLRVEIREEMGKIYGFATHSRPNEAFDYGELRALCFVESSDVTKIGLKIVEIGQSLAQDGVTSDELFRALEPFLMHNDAIQLTNQWWLDIMDDSQTKPFHLNEARIRRQISSSSFTTEDINVVAAKYLQQEMAIRFEALPSANGNRYLRQPSQKYM